MKKYARFSFVIFLTISVALPLLAAAQTSPTNTKLILESPSGDRIGSPAIKSFSMGSDNTLVIYLSEPFNFVALDPPIQIDNTSGSYTGCEVSPPASVAATQGANLSFRVISSANATLSMVVDPDPGHTSFQNGTFSWNTAGNPQASPQIPPIPAGSYLAVFQASMGVEGPLSQLVVMITIGNTLTVNYVGQGTVSKNPDKEVYSPGETVKLTATPNTGYYYTGWSGLNAAEANGNTATVVMNNNRAVTANFGIIQTTLTTATAGTGTGTILPASGGTYAYGASVTLTATPGANSTFGGWRGCTSSTNQCTVEMTQSRTITATFNSQTVTYSLTTFVNPAGSGTILGGGTYNSGTPVQISAAPVSGYTFTSWSGNASGSVTPTLITMDGNKSVTANFTASSTGGTPPPGSTIITWNQRPIVSFAANETRTFIARVPQNAKSFVLEFYVMGNFVITGSFKMPLKPDGTPYLTTVGKTEFTGLTAGYEGAIRIKTADFVLDSTIYPGDFILTLTASAAGWGYLGASIYY